MKRWLLKAKPVSQKGASPLDVMALVISGIGIKAAVDGGGRETPTSDTPWQEEGG